MVTFQLPYRGTAKHIAFFYDDNFGVFRSVGLWGCWCSDGSRQNYTGRGELKWLVPNITNSWGGHSGHSLFSTSVERRYSVLGFGRLSLQRAWKDRMGPNCVHEVALARVVVGGVGRWPGLRGRRS